MRTGRLPAQRLGLGTVVNSNLTKGRRVMYWSTDAANSGDAANLTIADSTTYMSTIDAALVVGYMLNSNGSGSVGQMVVKSITYGSVAFVNDDTTLKQKSKISYVIIGSPDASYIVD